MGIAPVGLGSAQCPTRQPSFNWAETSKSVRLGARQSYEIEQRDEQSTGCWRGMMAHLRNWCRSVRDFLCGCWRSTSGASRRGDYDFSASSAGSTEPQGDH